MEVSVLTLSTPSVVHFGDTYQAVRIHMGPPGELKEPDSRCPADPCTRQLIEMKEQGAGIRNRMTLPQAAC